MEDVLAVGPFLSRRRIYPTVPFIIVADYRQPYRHLLKMSEILADVYQEFLILPDLHMISSKVAEELNEHQNIYWNRTKMVSVRWSEEE